MSEQIRLAELVAALSLAADLGMGQPMEQTLRTCLVSVKLAELAGVDTDVLAEVYYVALLRFLGCTADAHDTALAVGGDDIALRRAIAPVLNASPRDMAATVLPVVGAGVAGPRRAVMVAGFATRGKARARLGVNAHCEAAEVLAARLGLPERVRRGLAAAFEQWNGAGLPRGLSGEEIPLSARVVSIARDVEVLQRDGANVRSALTGRKAYDPVLAALACKHLDILVDVSAHPTPWDAVLDREPQPHLPLPDLDVALEVLADFVDLKSPCFAGHSRAVAGLASAAAPDHAELLRRAGLAHDLGRVAVPSGVWMRPEPLATADFEIIRLHPYYSERILTRSRATAALARTAGLHHEHLDGSGYHRGSFASEIPYPARVLAAAETWRTLTSTRFARPPLSPASATARLRHAAGLGRLDTDAVEAVIAVAHDRTPQRRAGALTEREVEVLRLLCTGATKKDVAATLVISPRTADHHVRHIYEKLGVRSRAAATLYATEHGLL